MRKRGSRLYEKLCSNEKYYIDFCSRLISNELCESVTCVKSLLQTDKFSTCITMDSRNVVLVLNMIDCLDNAFKHGHRYVDIDYITFLFASISKRVRVFNRFEFRINWGSFYDVYRAVCRYNEEGHIIASIILTLELLRQDKFPVVMDYTKLCELSEDNFWHEVYAYSNAEKALYEG